MQMRMDSVENKCLGLSAHWEAAAACEKKECKIFIRKKNHNTLFLKNSPWLPRYLFHQTKRLGEQESELADMNAQQN